MARKRRHRALLEVMGSSRGLNQQQPIQRKTRSPRKWWWQRKSADPTRNVTSFDPNDPTTSLTARSMNPSGFGQETSAEQSAASHDVSGDESESHHPIFTLPMNRMTLGIAAAAVVVVGGVVFLAGRGSHNPPMLTAIATEETIHPTPINPNATPSVLDIRPTGPATKKPADAVLAPVPNNAVKPIFASVAPQTLVVQDNRRTIGLNYVIVQSYPDEKSAIDARDALGKSGIQCTIERGLPGWAAASWFSVVGTTGFDKIRASAEFEKYVRSIETVGAKFAGASKFKKFEPRAYKWKIAQ